MLEIIGGPDRDRTDDLFHAMEARSQLRHRPTITVGQLSYFRRSGSIRQTVPGLRSELSSDSLEKAGNTPVLAGVQ
jgi:hypothetical protein